MSDETAKERIGSQHLPYVGHMDAQTLRLRDGGLLSIIAVSGLPFETADMDRINAHHKAWNASLVNLADSLSAVWVVTVRRRSADYPQGEFLSAFAAQLDAKYRARMNGAALYRNHQFVCVLTAMPVAPAEKLFSMFSKAGGASEAALAEQAEKHRQRVLGYQAALADVGARVLACYEDKGVAWSEIATALHWMLGGRMVRVPLTEGPVWSSAYQDRIVFGREQFEVRYPEGSMFGGVLALKDYPTMTKPTMLDRLLTAPCELIVSQSFRFLAKGDAKALIALRSRQVMRTGEMVAKQAPELALTEQRVIDNEVVLGEHQGSVTVFSADAKSLNEAMAEVRQLLMDGGAVVTREDMGLEAAFWSQMPGVTSLRARRGHITSRNFASFAPLHGFPSGRRAGNHWGDATAMFRTNSGSPLYFSWHVQDLGNTFICGPSGSGKTVVMNFLLAQSLKHNPRIVLFDKDRGCDLFVRAVGGDYLALKAGRPTGCAPLKALEINEATEPWFTRWIIALAGGSVTTEERGAIAAALSALKGVEKGMRSIEGLRVYLDGTTTDGLSKRLERWQRGQSLGWVFDAPSDHISLSSRVIGYDMTDVLDMPEVRGPLMDYLFYRIEAIINGEPVIIAIDEFWKALEDEAFVSFVKNKLKTIRKQNGLLVLATQSPRDALRSPIAHAIIEQCPTQIYMPNSKASVEDYRGGMKLSAREYALVSELLSVGSRRFLVKQAASADDGGARSYGGIIAELNLGGFDDELTVLSGRTSSVELLDEIRAEVGDDPAVWLQVLLERMRQSSSVRRAAA